MIAKLNSAFGKAGMMLGPSFLGKYKKYEGIADIPSQVQFSNVMSYIGFLYYVFIIAVKTDTSIILRFRKQYWIMGALSMFIPFIIMVTLNIKLKAIAYNVIVTNFVFPLQISSTWFINLVPILDDLNLLTTEFGQLSLSLGLTNEILTWLGVIFIILHKTVNRGFKKSFLPLGVMLFTMIGVVRPLILWVVKKLPRGQPVKDMYIIGVLLGAGMTAFLSDFLVGSPLMGMVLIGLVIPHGPPLGSAVVERSETFVKHCLLPFFFIAVGDSLTLSMPHLRGQVLYQMIIVIGPLTKTVIIVLLAVWYDMSVQQGLALAFIMNTSGVVHIMSYWCQWIRQRADNQVTSQLILTSMVITAISTPLACYFHKQSRKDDLSIRGFQLSVQSAMSSSRMHILACVDNEEDIPGLINLLKASNPTNSNPICVYLLHLVELVGQAAPRLIPHRKHNRICKYNGCIHIMNAVKTYCDTTEGGITIQLLTMIAPFTTIYEGICKLAEDKMIPLIIVPFIYKSQSHFGNSVSSQLNTKLQRQTPCTLGIFVNKDSSNKQLNQSYFSYHIAVIFCGGEDDREVLTYATRMSTHPGVSITMLRIYVEEYANKNEDDILLDNSVVNKFKDKIINNACAVYKEFHVEECLQTLNVVQSIEKNYDLVMLGRRHGQQILMDEDVYILSENPELGEIGELIVSAELNWENTSFLVMQHCLASDKEMLGNTILLND